MKRLSVSSGRREEFVDITSLVREQIGQSGVDEGSCIVYCPHTTAAVTLNERADPAVARDMIAALDRVVPDGVAWTHAEGNSRAHVKASLMGCSVQVLIRDGDLAVGTWQGIFLCEFDGPRTREIWLRFVP